MIVDCECLTEPGSREDGRAAIESPGVDCTESGWAVEKEWIRSAESG